MGIGHIVNLFSILAKSYSHLGNILLYSTVQYNAKTFVSSTVVDCWVESEAQHNNHNILHPAKQPTVCRKLFIVYCLFELY